MRRVLGASPANIAYHLNVNYLLVMLGATVIGCLSGRVFALAMMNSIYKIHAGVSAGVLFFAVFCVLGALALTIGLKVWQILRVNLSTALKVE